VRSNVRENNLYIILIYIQQDATLHGLFYLETALHVSGGTITHHQERKQLYLQHLVFVTPLLLPAAIVEEVELVWLCCAVNSTLKPETCRAVSRLSKLYRCTDPLTLKSCIIQFYPTPFYILHLRFKYVPLDVVPKYPVTVFFSECNRPK